jgi:hypothetical protein
MMRVRRDIHETLHDLAAQEHMSMQDVLAKALDDYRRHRLLDETNRAYAALRANMDAWREIKEEQRLLDGTLMDGLTVEPEFASWQSSGDSADSQH